MKNKKLQNDAHTAASDINKLITELIATIEDLEEKLHEAHNKIDELQQKINDR